MHIGRSARLAIVVGPLALASACGPRSTDSAGDAGASDTAQASPAVGAEAAPQSDDEKTLYALGMMMARTLDAFGLSEAEWKWVQRGAADRVLGRPPAVDVAEYQARVQALHQERRTPSPEVLEGHRAFLEEQAAAEGAVRTDSGLIYTELVAGSGPSPQPSDTVEVHYHGTLRDGTVFDSSVQRGKPASFALARVIPCWTEGVGMMKVGGKARLVCPAGLAYGSRGSGKIPPDAPIVFEVELLGIGE